MTIFKIFKDGFGHMLFKANSKTFFADRNTAWPLLYQSRN